MLWVPDGVLLPASVGGWVCVCVCGCGCSSPRCRWQGHAEPLATLEEAGVALLFGGVWGMFGLLAGRCFSLWAAAVLLCARNLRSRKTSQGLSKDDSSASATSAAAAQKTNNGKHASSTSRMCCCCRPVLHAGARFSPSPWIPRFPVKYRNWKSACLYIPKVPLGVSSAGCRSKRFSIFQPRGASSGGRAC